MADKYMDSIEKKNDLAIIIGRNIVKYRQLRHMTRRELAEMIYVEESTLGYWERGIYEPRLSALLRICDALKVTLDELMDWKAGTGLVITDPGEKMFVSFFLNVYRNDYDGYIEMMEAVSRIKKDK